LKLKGKVAIITGSGRGLGRAAAIAMAREGASVLVLSRTQSEIRETEKTITLAGGRAVSLRADVSKPGDVEKAVGRAVSEFGGLDILMNNAAIIGPIKPLHEVAREDWAYAMGVNLGGAYMFSRASVPHMMRRGGGKIINVTSGLGSMVYPMFGTYSVAKSGLIHLTRVMAAELAGHGIQVNGLDPGVMDTRMQEEVRELGPGALGEKVYQDFLDMKTEGHLRPPGEAARLALFLASADSGSTTGENGDEDFYEGLGYRPDDYEGG